MDKPAGNLLRDPTAGVVCHMPDDRFIPIRACDLVSAVAEDDRFGDDHERLREVALALQDVIDQEALAFSRAITDCYAAFNPDRDTIPLSQDGATDKSAEQMHTWIEYVFEKANFEQLDDVEIEEAIHAANTQGLRVRLRPELIEEMSLWVRGRSTMQRRFRTWRHPIRGVERELVVYRRLVVMARLHDDPNISLKLFKDIPIADLEALLPHAEVRMSWFDRFKAFGGGAGAAGSLVAKLLKLFTTVVVASRLMWILLAGFGLICLRAILGYRSTRRMRDSQRTQHLYYQNLDNNAGVIHTLISMIAQEELKEAVLGYAFCRTESDAIHGEADLARVVNNYLRERFDADVQFDAPDAIETITRLHLWADADELKPLEPDQAVRLLQRHWRTRASRPYHEQMACRSAPE
ncbi:MAG: DUF3754 domain-containing protein [Phycisphaerales bacterium]|nr:DUF3754 domain-containing protein [Phycisphaerales bacterium]